MEDLRINFIVRPIRYVELIFVYAMRCGSKFIFKHWITYCSSTIFRKDCPFSTEFLFHFHHKSASHVRMGLFLGSVSLVSLSLCLCHFVSMILAL